MVATRTYSDLLDLADAVQPYSRSPGGPGVPPGANGQQPSTQGQGPACLCQTANLQEERTAAALKLQVMGERENGTAVIWAYHPKRCRTVEIKDLDRLTYAKLLQVAGPHIPDVVDESGDDPFGKCSLTQVRNTLCLLAGHRRVGEDDLLGPGCWQPLDDHGDDTPGVLLVGAGEAAHWDGADLHRIKSPVACGRMLDLSSPNPWYDFDNLQAALRGYSPEKAIATIDRAAQLFARWRWRAENHPETVVGLILATWVQTLWPWRPHVGLVGASKSGKSTLLEVLDDLFCGLAIRSSKSTAAGIRQRIKSSAKVVLVDEFEESRHRPEILEMLRAASRGDEVLRGTITHRGVQHIMRHLCWVAAVEIGLKRAPDRNRYIMLETVLPEPENQGKLRKPPTSEMHTLGTDLLAIAIRSVTAAKALALRLKAASIKGVDSRVIESYAIPASILGVACGFSETDTLGMLKNLLIGETSEEPEDPSDERDLLRQIAAADMRGDKGVTQTVAEALANYGADALELLGRHGITLCSDRRGPRAGSDSAQDVDFLFIDHRVVASKLLKGSSWERQNLDTILLRVDGARPTRRSVGKRRCYGVIVPWDWLKQHIFSADTLEFG